MSYIILAKNGHEMSLYYTSEKWAFRARISALFITVTFENYEWYFL